MMKLSNVIKTTLNIGEMELQVEEGLLPISSLYFYAENPRIYSILQASKLSQIEIEAEMRNFDHVKQLVQSISKVGLIDSLIVRKKDMAVLEGNSRLAAFRILSERDAITYAKARCKLIIDDISDDDVDTLLGQYHIVGRKDWEPYEQGAFLSRLVSRGKSPEILAEEYGISPTDIRASIRNYEFMEEHEIDDVKTWSYWDEYLKSRNVKRVRDDENLMGSLDSLVIRQVLNGSIERAQDIRKLSNICSVINDRRRGHIFTDYLDENISFDDACEQYTAGEDAASVIKKCKSFKEFINSADTRACIDSMSKPERKALDFEIRKIMLGLKQL
jgi:hypothetical protein